MVSDYYDIIAIMLYTISILYRHILKPILFRFPADDVHQWFLSIGEWCGRSVFIRWIIGKLLSYDDSRLNSEIAGIKFENPIGLAAGFDYDGQLINILPSVGFGFQTIGTVTDQSYDGNPKPMLGRLPMSRSLLVNKGFKNSGMSLILENLKGVKFDHVVGISIGKTNARKSTMTQVEAVQDILSAFKKVKASPVPFSYCELNISCPNLSGDVTFYEPIKLEQLLSAITELNIIRPIFIKMPITLSDDGTTALLDIIVKFSIAGVIIGNLHKNRQDPMLITEEVTKCGDGSFSGKPAEKRSNELIRLAYSQYGRKLIIIGCGGVFTAEDAYKKIKLGASLIQLITGMVYMGPSQIGIINRGLVKLLERDGYKNIIDAIGASTVRLST